MTNIFDPLQSFASGGSAAANFVWDGSRWVPQTSGGGGASGDVNVTNTSIPVTIASMPSTPVTGVFFQSTQPVSIASTVPVSFTNLALTDTQLRASAVSVNFTNSTLAVTGPLTDTQLRASAVPVSLASTTITNFPATQPISGTVSISGTVPVSFTDAALTDTQLRASAVPVTLSSTTITGTVSATQSGTWNIGSITTMPTTAVTGPLTDTQLRATAVPVSLASTTITGTAAATQSGTWTVQPGNTANTTAWKVDGSAVTQPVSFTNLALTDTQLRASAVPVTLTSTTITGTVSSTQSGTWNIGSVTTLPALPANQSINNAQINGVTPLMGNGTTGTGSQRVTIASDNTAFSVNSVQSGTWTVQPGNTANTTAWKVDGSAVTQPVSLVSTTITGTVAATQSGAWGTTGIADLITSGSLTGTTSVTQTNTSGLNTSNIQITGTWVGTVQFEASVDGSNYFSVNAQVPTTGALVTSATANGSWTVNVAGCKNFRVRCSAFTSGTIVVAIDASTAPSLVGLDAPLPTGANVIGAMTTDLTTPGTTNLVSIGSDGTVALGTGTNTIGRVTLTDTLTFASSLTSTGTFFTQDMTNYNSVTIQVTSAGTSCTITNEWSNDNITYLTASGNTTSATGVITTVTTTTTTGLYVYPRRARYFRSRVSAYLSGTVTIAANCTQSPGPYFLTATSGPIAAGNAISGNPLLLGVTARTANPTAVTDGQLANLLSDKMGRLVTVTSQFRDLVAVQQTTITSSTAETTIITAIASTFCDITNLTITNSSATATLITLKDATSGTTRGIYSIAANGGMVIPFNPPLAQASVNNNWTVTCGTSVASIYVVAQYAKNL